MPLLETYEEARLLWEAKGWGLGAVAKHLSEDPKLAEFNFSQPTLSRRVDDAAAIPPAVAEAIEGLETRRNQQRRTEIVEEGLRVLHGRASQRQALELALALLAHFPTDAFAVKVADALANQANGKLDTMQATLNHADAQLEVIDTKIDRNSRAMLRGLWAAVAVGSLGALASMASCVASISQRLAPAAPVASAPAPAPVHEVTVNIGPAAMEKTTRCKAFAEDHHLGTVASGTGEMGEKAQPERWIPSQPLPYQKLPPCDARLGESAINGGCWAGMSDVKPPCGLLFRNGDKCYRPIAADPQKPVGINPEEPR